MRKENQKKPPCSKAAPCFTRAGLSFLGGASGLALVVFTLESNKHIRRRVPDAGDVSSAGYIQRNFFATLRRCSFAQKVLLIERFCQVGWADFEPQSCQVFPQLCRHGPSQLTMALFPVALILVVEEFSGPGEGAGAGLTQNDCGKGQREEWTSQARREVFGFP